MFRVVGVMLIFVCVRADELISIKNGQIGVNLGGYRASAGLGGILTGNAADGGLSASAGTPLGHHASAGLGGSIGSEASGGLYASAGSPINKGSVASAGIYGSSDTAVVTGEETPRTANGGIYKYATFDSSHTIHKSISPIANASPAAPAQPVEPIYPIVPVLPIIPATSVQKIKVHRFFKTKHHSRLHDKHLAAKEIAIQHSVSQGGSLEAGTGNVGGAGNVGSSADVGVDGASGSAIVGGSSGATYSSSSTFQFNKHGPGLLDDIFAIPIATLQAVNNLVRNSAAQSGSAQFSVNKYKTIEHSG